MKKWLKRVLFALLGAAAVFGLLTGIEVFGGHPMGLFAGTRPDNLGFSQGRFAPPSWKPNCVSSTVDKADSHYIAPLAVGADVASAWNKLGQIVRALPGATIVRADTGYLYAEFKSRGLGFVDDVEFALDGAA
ncbi:MAG TPA: DUF1499 domain-containing protein, partial [Usitatibacteraceae bacterium]|nr:DUF1499 domain-containing protein [Usitatibacteraceae bacterium]